MFERIQKNIALKAYEKKLGPLLQKRYGKSESYTPGQIQTTSRIVGLNEKYLFYGYVLFCIEDSFNHELSGSESGLDYHAMRQELGDKFFKGDYNFDISDIIPTYNEMGTPSTGDSGGTSVYH